MQLVAYGAQDIHLTSILHFQINSENTIENTNTWEYIDEKLNEEIECCVSFETITDEYISCDKCKKIFDIQVKDMWIENKKHCPHCRQEWTNYIIYRNK